MNLNISSMKEVGGPGGHQFVAGAEGKVRGFYIRSGAWIDALQVAYINPFGQEDSTERFGGQGGGLGSFILEPTERVTRITFTTGQYVNSISIETSLNKRVTFGQQTGTPVMFVIPENSEFAGFYGKCGAYIDSIGILINKDFNPGQDVLQGSIL